jgi:hypothetical protein
MSRIETNLFSSQDDLPPEIERRLQVEELWARRNVLADLMNAERLRVYALRRTHWAADFLDVEARGTFTRLAATIVPIKNRKAPAARSLSAAGLGLSPQPANHLRAN